MYCLKTKSSKFIISNMIQNLKLNNMICKKNVIWNQSYAFYNMSNNLDDISF